LKFLYNIFISLFVTVFKIGAVFNYKLKRGLAGRRQSCQILEEKLSPEDRVIWMHAASLGEYEQGLPVLEKLKQYFPEHKFLITFFSPSGYENVRKKGSFADVICYLPFDREVWVKEFVSKLNVEIFFTVKYDFWYNALHEIKNSGALTYAVSAYFYKKQVYFKPYGKWFVQNLKKDINWFFHQTEKSNIFARRIGLLHSSTSGDTRYDRVRQNLVRDNTVPFIQEFKEKMTTVVFGSSWQAEERIAEVLANSRKDVKIIIAPHDLKRVDVLKKAFPNALLYSEMIKLDTLYMDNAQVLIIDSIGLLSKLYSYADIAVVGGGFHSKGLHNILEASVFGVPVIFGNHYRKNPEADALLAGKGGKAFEDEFFASKYITELLKRPDLMKDMGENAKRFIMMQPNAAEIVFRKITSDYERKFS